MFTPNRRFIALALAAGLAACGGSAAPGVDEALARDLALVGSTTSSLELAPTASGVRVMSSLELGEQSPAAVQAPSPERKRVAQVKPQPTKPRIRAPRPEPTQVEIVEAPAQVEEQVVEAPPPAPEPEPIVSAPAPSSPPLGAGPAPPGGWKSVGEVIRNSRIPIKP